MGEPITVYLTGADGMLGTALVEAFRQDRATADWQVYGVSRADFDIADGEAVAESMAKVRPHVVVHTAAHAVVDACESDARLAMRVNTLGVRHVVAGCRRYGSRLIYLSSDYVFDGRQPPPHGYRESDLPSPLSIYGLTKLAGERICELWENRLIIRTSWLFGGADERVDPVLATIRQAAAGKPSKLIADQFSRPTYAVDLAVKIVTLLHEHPSLTGIIHIANEGVASWYDLGGYALAEIFGECPDQALEAFRLADSKLVGDRPSNSVLNTDRLAALGLRLPHWQDAVHRFCGRLQTADPYITRSKLTVGRVQ